MSRPRAVHIPSIDKVPFYVRSVGRWWTFGRRKQPLLTFESKGAAVARGKDFVAKMDYATLVVEDNDPVQPQALRDPTRR